MTDIHIPPEALEAVAAYIYSLDAFDPDLMPWADASDLTKHVYRGHASAALQAGLRAWPGMDTTTHPRMVRPGQFAPQDYIRLPLPPKENPDDVV